MRKNKHKFRQKYMLYTGTFDNSRMIIQRSSLAWQHIFEPGESLHEEAER